MTSDNNHVEHAGSHATQAGFTASTPHAGYAGSYAPTQASFTASTPHWISCPY